MMKTHNLSLRRVAFRIPGVFGLLSLAAGIARAQAVGVGPIVPSGGVEYSQPGSPVDTGVPAGPNVYFDQPTGNSSMPQPPGPPQPTAFVKTLQAICWYIPNRLMDLSDIPRIHLSLGDGQGFSLRLTRYLTASWFQDDAYCLGWTKRTAPWFGESLQERYFGFLAAHEGEPVRPDGSEVGLSVHLLIAGANVAVSLGEAADAVAGLAGIDLMGDDHGPVLFDTTPPPTPESLRLQKAVYGPQGPVRTNPLPPGIAPALPPKPTPVPGEAPMPPATLQPSSASPRTAPPAAAQPDAAKESAANRKDPPLALPEVANEVTVIKSNEATEIKTDVNLEPDRPEDLRH